jgi:hypothetical protein
MSPPTYASRKDRYAAGRACSQNIFEIGPMKVIVAGSRGITESTLVARAIQTSGFYVTELVSGGAKGADRLGEAYAKQHGIPVRQFIPNWGTGRGAGMKNNSDMANYADALVAIWDGQSRGTKNMIERMRKMNKPVHVVLMQPESPDL